MGNSTMSHLQQAAAAAGPSWASVHQMQCAQQYRNWLKFTLRQHKDRNPAVAAAAAATAAATTILHERETNQLLDAMKR
jgi:hypothetical protein